ncbi:hypothetical protein M6B38_341240 [Iris pallida]|uniref:Uncharacterized protein n=1 Tax=Iris pallida TaxID=29817 RepID=A0AAX6GXT9_IRIPA|nr:hypothetical protein M6B38_341240 [Iris pallida]
MVVKGVKLPETPSPIRDLFFPISSIHFSQTLTLYLLPHRLTNPTNPNPEKTREGGQAIEPRLTGDDCNVQGGGSSSGGRRQMMTAAGAATTLIQARRCSDSQGTAGSKLRGGEETMHPTLAVEEERVDLADLDRHVLALRLTARSSRRREVSSINLGGDPIDVGRWFQRAKPNIVVIGFRSGHGEQR